MSNSSLIISIVIGAAPKKLKRAGLVSGRTSQSFFCFSDFSFLIFGAACHFKLGDSYNCFK